jgi:hypothetical protein
MLKSPQRMKGIAVSQVTAAAKKCNYFYNRSCKGAKN